MTNDGSIDDDARKDSQPHTLMMDPRRIDPSLNKVHTSCAMEQHFPFKHCEVCGRSRTSWCISYPQRGQFPGEVWAPWHRTCPYCMTPAEHAQMLMLVNETTRTRQRVIVKWGERR